MCPITRALEIMRRKSSGRSPIESGSKSGILNELCKCCSIKKRSSSAATWAPAAIGTNASFPQTWIDGLRFVCFVEKNPFSFNALCVCASCAPLTFVPQKHLRFVLRLVAHLNPLYPYALRGRLMATPRRNREGEEDGRTHRRCSGKCPT